MYRNAIARGKIFITDEPKNPIVRNTVMEIFTHTLDIAPDEKVQILSLFDSRALCLSIAITPEVRNLLKEVIECTQ